MQCAIQCESKAEKEKTNIAQTNNKTNGSNFNARVLREASASNKWQWHGRFIFLALKFHAEKPTAKSKKTTNWRYAQVTALLNCYVNVIILSALFVCLIPCLATELDGKGLKRFINTFFSPFSLSSNAHTLWSSHLKFDLIYGLVFFSCILIKMTKKNTKCVVLCSCFFSSLSPMPRLHVNGF